MSLKGIFFLGFSAWGLPRRFPFEPIFLSVGGEKEEEEKVLVKGGGVRGLAEARGSAGADKRRLRLLRDIADIAVVLSLLNTSCDDTWRMR
mmetsp:Transcript_13890/g.18110  ORF Transcript_13890/g.18110 Transcript_13890/m.18110 type:complete len:91 (-) Transcript_13890:1406-1678(-)